jgi:hypothetical protein
MRICIFLNKKYVEFAVAVEVPEEKHTQYNNNNNKL